MNSEKQSFDSCFEVFLADTPESKQIHYNLRYQVYCEEMGFEDKDKFPDQLEFDDWDDHSSHFLVRHRHTGHWLGAMRLVFQNQSAFPFQDKCAPDNGMTAKHYHQAVEVSRLCVIKEARRFSPSKYAPYGLMDDDLLKESSNIKYLYNHKNQCRSIMWGLFRAAAVYSAQQNLEHWYFLVAPALACFIRKSGVDLRQIGEACEYRGHRIPYRLSVDNILANPLWQTDYKKDFRRYSELTEESFISRRACS